MNPVSIFNSAARGTGLKDADGGSAREADDAGGTDAFARMLEPAAQPRSQAQPTTPPTQRDEAPSRREAAHKDEEGQPREGRGDAGENTEARRAEGQRGRAHAERDRGDNPHTDTAEAGPRGTEPEDGTEAADALWPPPGLGGFGLVLLAQTPPAATAGGEPAAALPAALPGGVVGATTLPSAPAAGPAALGAGPALALPATQGASAAIAQGEADQGLAALAANLAAGQPAAGEGAGDALQAGSVDGLDNPAFVLPNLPQTVARVHDSAPFTASPTPTPALQGEGFDDAVSTRVAWLADQKIGHAHIKITPNDLGPVEVRLQLDGDKVQASFSSAHADVRQALEQSLPRLREMLGQHGFQLTHSDVGSRQQGQQGGERPGTAVADGRSDPLGNEDSAVVVPARVLRARGLLDAYA